MTTTFRPLADDDEQRAAAELGRLAFGGSRLAPDAPLPPRPGRIMWGAFDGGRLVAMVGDWQQDQWYGGRLVPASGISAVAVGAGDRSKGHAKRLLAVVLEGARDRGAVVSTLFPTAPALYRQLGWELTGAFSYWDLQTSWLAGLRAPAGTTIRPATPDDREAILAVYADLARGSSGYLERSDARFPRWPFNPDTGLDGVTVAVGGSGRIDGFTTWVRGHGMGRDTRLTVHDLHGRTRDATLALLADLGSWDAVAPTLTVLLPRPDPAWWLIPNGVPLARETHHWMTRVVDLKAAVEARGWPANIEVSVDLEVTDEVCPWNAGRFTLAVADGKGSLTPGGAGDVSIGGPGLGVLFAGGTNAATMRRAGLIGGAGSDAALDALMAGPAPSTVDHF